MVAIAGVHGVLAPFAYPQEQITRALGAMLSPDGAHVELVEKIHAATGVRSRNLALELADYPDLDDFGAANDVFIRVGLDLGEQAIRGALDKAGLSAEDVDLVVSTSVTGIAAPSLEARLVPRLGLRAGRQADADLRPRVRGRGGRDRPGARLPAAAIPTGWRCCSRSSCAR